MVSPAACSWYRFLKLSAICEFLASLLSNSVTAGTGSEICRGGMAFRRISSASCWALLFFFESGNTIPGESRILSLLSIFTSLREVVTPAWFPTGHTDDDPPCLDVRAFITDDFPTLGYPITPTTMARFKFDFCEYDFRACKRVAAEDACVNFRSTLFTTKISLFPEFCNTASSTFRERVPSGSRASKTYNTTSDASTTDLKILSNCFLDFSCWLVYSSSSLSVMSYSFTSSSSSSIGSVSPCPENSSAAFSADSSSAARWFPPSSCSSSSSLIISSSCVVSVFFNSFCLSLSSCSILFVVSIWVII
ncbi:hypothetical protein OGATHE_002859 [Ogataea polymorpha]|uniref:Secreted protein n=1 Tax=Ogataea polymorpha TaxID=460523 RepID=A0A9P8PDX9_9ASCO|nr:hypothetical protein OGATHE_002859 [Ogataea polymorpha]